MFGWVGGEGVLGQPGYRLLLVVRVAGMPEEDLFRVEFPSELLPEFADVTEEKTTVLVSERKGVFFPESGEVYLQALQEAGGDGLPSGIARPARSWDLWRTDGPVRKFFSHP